MGKVDAQRTGPTHVVLDEAVVERRRLALVLVAGGAGRGVHRGEHVGDGQEAERRGGGRRHVGGLERHAHEAADAGHVDDAGGEKVRHGAPQQVKVELHVVFGHCVLADDAVAKLRLLLQRRTQHSRHVHLHCTSHTYARLYTSCSRVNHYTAYW